MLIVLGESAKAPTTLIIAPMAIATAQNPPVTTTQEALTPRRVPPKIVKFIGLIICRLTGAKKSQKAKTLRKTAKPAT